MSLNVESLTRVITGEGSQEMCIHLRGNVSHSISWESVTMKLQPLHGAHYRRSHCCKHRHVLNRRRPYGRCFFFSIIVIESVIVRTLIINALPLSSLQASLLAFQCGGHSTTICTIPLLATVALRSLFSSSLKSDHSNDSIRTLSSHLGPEMLNFHYKIIHQISAIPLPDPQSIIQGGAD
jgi:hypothetical protein